MSTPGIRSSPLASLPGFRALTPALPEAARVLHRGLDCEVVASNRGIGIHRMLQRLADRKIPLVRAMGFHYLVLATKLA
jgi:hypothetical protein